MVPIIPAEAHIEKGNKKQEAPSVLVVDDNPDLLEMLADLLSGEFKIQTAKDAQEAVGKLNEFQFHAVLCDIMMPGTSGMELFQSLQKTRPEIAEKFLFMTGGSISEEVRDFISKMSDRTIEKPFRMDQLMQRLGERIAKSG